MDVPTLNAVSEYWLDAFQRTVLFLDVLRERGNQNREHNESAVPNVLTFKAELVHDGRTLPRPVNYLLVRIIPTADKPIDPTKPPFIVVDPRAGHGPGIGGMKQDSEIGVAMAAGHPCYFIGFLPQPCPGQTIEDVCRAEAAFIEEVASLHPTADGKPVIVANCQAGWQIMMTAARCPDLAGPILLAGSPLSYWAGVRGKNPLRYLGGALGGTWLTTLAGDMGHGIFDGANLVANFESLNPANTYWQKAYNVYSNIDKEAERFLEFETWWGSPVLLNAEEMQWIADNLFVGNKLATGEIRSSDGVRIDLRNIKSPIVVFCSWGDNITPPQQALGWITDLYNHEREIVENGQTIVYTLHQSIGHLGIFVSGKVATKEHEEFASCMEMINLMPPGLYEAVITEVEPDTENPELIHGKYLFRLEARGLDHIRALGANTPEDDQRFATVARVSEINQGLYRTLLGPAVRMATNEQSAALQRRLHPNRLRFSVFSDRNPAMQPIKAIAGNIRENRRPASPDNPLLAVEKAVSDGIVRWLDAWGQAHDTMMESFFLNTYGSPLLQAMVGLGPQVPAVHRRIERDLAREATQAHLRAELETQFDKGGMAEAAVRALVYIRLPGGSVDERGFAVLQAVREAQPADKRPTLAQLKELFRTQYLLVVLDEQRAIRTLPALLPRDPAKRREALDVLHRMLVARGTLDAEGQRRLAEIETVFDAEPVKPSRKEPAHA
jgi:pimeloyl-ACP methyl ester carboxylesterase